MWLGTGYHLLWKQIHAFTKLIKYFLSNLYHFHIEHVYIKYIQILSVKGNTQLSKLCWPAGMIVSNKSVRSWNNKKKKNWKTSSQALLCL